MSREDLYELVIELEELKFDKLQHKAMIDGFNEPEEAVHFIIEKYLRKSELNISSVMSNAYCNEIMAITSYSRLLKCIKESILKLLEITEAFFVLIKSTYKKITLNKYCDEKLSLGQVLRASARGFEGFLDSFEINTVKYFLYQKYPDKTLLIHKHFNSQSQDSMIN